MKNAKTFMSKTKISTIIAILMIALTVTMIVDFPFDPRPNNV